MVSLPGGADAGLRGSSSMRKSVRWMSLGDICRQALVAVACTALAWPLAAIPIGFSFAQSTPPRVASTAKGDELLMVDCLLPGQIRRLGGQVTYLTARRPAKTSARDCEIRGGEYVAFDRGDYATALKVWRPLADNGDPAAQTYVGEIYEKGLGVPPDYAAAADWYRKAAEKGYGRAAINLGNLYEQGLGVPRDPTQAANWYRQAAGMKNVSFAPPPLQSTGPDVQRLQTEVAGLRSELQLKQGELERAKREIGALQKNLDDRRVETDAERATLARLRQELERRGKEQAGSSRVRELEQAIAEREARLVTKEREVTELHASLAKSEAESSSRRTELDRLQQRAAETPPEIQIIEPELVASRDVQAIPRVVGSGRQLLIVGRVVTLAGVLSLTVDGNEVKVDANNLFKTSVPLKRPNDRIRIVAVDRGGRKATVEFLTAERSEAVTPRAGLPGEQTGQVGHARPKGSLSFGRYNALVIGNDAYRLLPPLKTAVGDAQEVARILEQDYGFKVRLLVNATRYDILSALNDLRQKLTDKDNLLIYYAGHGELDQKNQRGHWLPVDAEPTSSTNWISNVSITDILNAMSVQQLLVVADSCYSGTLARSALARLEPGLSERERIQLMQLMAQKRSRMVMTSGGIEPVSDSAGAKHSAFAQSFIELLQGNVGVVAGQEMFQLLRLRVVAQTERVDARQVPEYAPIKFAGHESGDFFFVRSN
jgi:hypothetical protein